MNGYFVNRFSDFLPGHRHAIPLLAAAFFSLAHLPNWFLTAWRTGVIGFLLYLVVPDTVSHHMYVGPKWFPL